MSHSGHEATVRWERRAEPFVDNRYSRAHAWLFDGGTEVPASASPANVPQGTADVSAVDPEEGFVAALASCHMLWFLSLAAAAGFVVERYEDEPVGHMREVRPQREALTEVILRPRVTFDPAHAPNAAALDALHHAAHDHCFLANSVNSTIRIEARS